MNSIEKRKKFLVNFAYFAIIIALVFALLKYGLPYVMPFLIGFLVAYLLNGPTNWLMARTKLSRKLCSILVITLTIAALAVLVSLVGVRLVEAVKTLLLSLPSLYTHNVEPYITELLQWYERTDLIAELGPTIGAALQSTEASILSSLGSLVTNISVKTATALTNFVTGFPSFLMTFLITIISAYFISADYDNIVSFLGRQMSPKTIEFLGYIKRNFVDTILKYLLSYGIILCITFVELSVVMFLAGVGKPLLIGLLIALFDILPIVGVATVLIPWIVIDIVAGAYTQAIVLTLGWLCITVIRNIIEPKIVGARVGLHPVLTLVCMYVGLKLFGILGMFGFPISLVMLKEMHKAGIIKLYKE